MNYQRNYNLLQQSQVKRLKKDNIYGAILIGIFIGLAAFIAYTHIHNSDKAMAAHYQQLTNMHIQQVEVQGTVQGNLIQ